MGANNLEIKRIIDISTWQRPSAINYDLLSKEIDGVILRAGFTGTDTGHDYVIDNTFERHYAEFHKRGVPIGAYWYACANTASEGRAEAKQLLNAVKGKVMSLPLYWDSEDNVHQRPTSKAQLTDAAEAFCQEIEKAGYYVGIYASASWLNSELDMARLKDYDVWVAHYTDAAKPAYSGAYGMWQYTSQGRLNGYSGNLDVNRAYKDYLAIIKAAGLNGFPKPDKPVVEPKPEVKPEPKPVVEVKPEPKPEVKPEPVKEEYIVETVKAYDTLSAYAEKHGVTVEAILAVNPSIYNRNLIFINQKVVIPVKEKATGGSTAKTYKVQSGDTLTKIAKDHKTTVAKLVKLNNIADKNKIYTGQILTVG